jgi:hypothetical protein
MLVGENACLVEKIERELNEPYMPSSIAATARSMER